MVPFPAQASALAQLGEATEAVPLPNYIDYLTHRRALPFDQLVASGFHNHPALWDLLPILAEVHCSGFAARGAYGSRRLPSRIARALRAPAFPSSAASAVASSRSSSTA
jgi:hypothetical protein